MTELQAEEEKKQARLGAIFGALAYTSWGFFPLYFRTAAPAGPVELTAHRAVWAFFCLLGIMYFRRELRGFIGIFKRPKVALCLAASTLFIIGNWTIFVYGVLTDRTRYTSLGYFINPLFSVFLGFVFLRERLRPLQWLSVALAFIGVAYKTVEAGVLPWISLGLAGCFGMYGLIRKQINVTAPQGLGFETMLMLIPGIAYIAWGESTGRGTFMSEPLDHKFILFCAGFVTITPLLFFGGAARRLRLATLGFLQYIAPTIQLWFAIVIFNEPFETVDRVCFSLIWIGLAIYSFDTWRSMRKEGKKLMEKRES